MATPRTMAPARILFEEIAPNSSSPAFRASQIRWVFTATKLLSLPATLRELWYRVLVSGFVMGENKAEGAARYCGHCERTHLTSSDRHFGSITHTFALCPLASSVWALACSLMVVPTYRGDSGVFTIEFGPGGDPRFPRPCISTHPGIRLCKPDFFCSSPGALGLPPLLCTATANSLQQKESDMPSPTPTSCLV